MDVYAKATRTAVMRAVKSEDTSPEMAVRRMLHRAGYRYRLHRRDLPGKPDIVFPRKRKVVFVHGCFWHQHASCERADRPASNRRYWDAKLDGNLARDSQHEAALRALGWEVLVVWECQLADRDSLMATLASFLS